MLIFLRITTDLDTQNVRNLEYLSPKSTLACFTKVAKCMTLSVLETSLPMQRSHDTLALRLVYIYRLHLRLCQVVYHCVNGNGPSSFRIGTEPILKEDGPSLFTQ